ncbi:MAG: deoxyribodipyrimidine photo-lyase, partial [Bacteroidota bacterium]|nr:deoxyribodipyrimidine photo-lyase [Bacteroidota bacterium]MDX5431056.1 deoxyribodipyrimidine photo-lyase [Bacteroidota bacterium]MDX5469810.1 deoxyribodipyrimidine photo-lyase [Bacteroidota bacterium]
MTQPAINVVWLKRDLRLQDHAPLFEAEKAGLPYLILYCFEPSLIAHPDTSARHLQFIYASLQEMNQKLQKKGRHVEICHAEILEVLKALQEHYRI